MSPATAGTNSCQTRNPTPWFPAMTINNPNSCSGRGHSTVLSTKNPTAFLFPPHSTEPQLTFSELFPRMSSCSYLGVPWGWKYTAWHSHSRRQTAELSLEQSSFLGPLHPRLSSHLLNSSSGVHFPEDPRVLFLCLSTARFPELQNLKAGCWERVLADCSLGFRPSL